MLRQLIDKKLTGPAALLRLIGEDHTGMGVVVVDTDTSKVVGTAQDTMTEYVRLLDSLDDSYNYGIIYLYNNISDEPKFSFADRIMMNAFSDGIQYTVGICTVLDVLVRKGDRFISTICDSPHCCPPEGKSVDSNILLVGSNA